MRDQKGTDSSPLGHHLLCLDRMEQGPGAGPVALDELVVRERADGFLGLHSPSRGEDYWLCPDYDDNGLDVGGLAQCALPAMELPEIRLGEHTPRIVVDGVVLQRRRWDPPPGSVPVASTGRVTATEWRAVRQWAGRLGMPRYLFFRTDASPKPMWLDLASPLSVTNLSHALRGARSVAFHEMLPHPNALWLRTPGGALVSEIRTLVLRGTDPTRGARGTPRKAQRLAARRRRDGGVGPGGGPSRPARLCRHAAPPGRLGGTRHPARPARRGRCPAARRGGAGAGPGGTRRSRHAPPR